MRSRFIIALLVLFTLGLIVVRPNAQVQIVEDISDCGEDYLGRWSTADKRFKCKAPMLLGAGNPGDVPISNGTMYAPGPPPSGGIPAGAVILVASGSCPASFSEVVALDGVTLVGTLAAHGDVGTTGGADDITPTVDSLEAAAQTFTGTPFSGVINHTHPVTDPGHAHVEQAPSSASSGAMKFGIDTNASGTQGAGISTEIAATGVTTNNPAGGVASITPAGTNSTSAVTGTLNQFDNRSAFVKVIFCSKD